MSNAENIFYKAIEGSQAENDYPVLTSILLEYISNQESDEAFQSFLDEHGGLKSFDLDAIDPVQDEVVLYRYGHKCIPNRTGDYTFVCPTKGDAPGFIPYMHRSLIKGTCACGKKIELEEEPK